MAQTNPDLIAALRETARRLEDGADYEWGHMGRCNCGHLVQAISGLTDHEIVESIDLELDEWTEHAKDYCEGTGSKVQSLFLTLKAVGFGQQDVIHLENLSDPRVLDRLPDGRRHLVRNDVEDVHPLHECARPGPRVGHGGNALSRAPHARARVRRSP